MDPRLAVVGRRLEGVRRVLAVTGGKGGIGKSTVASTLALMLARSGRRVGLLDLDLTGPSTHLVLGYPTGFPSEEFGIDPPIYAGIRCLTVAHFTHGAAAPMRGDDTTNALLELLAITRWGELDELVVDMPPGLGDATLDVLRLVPRTGYVVVATPSVIVRETVRHMLRFLGRQRADVVGVIENMWREQTDPAELAREFSVPHLGTVPFDPTLEAAYGDVERLAATPAALALGACADAVVTSGEET